MGKLKAIDFFIWGGRHEDPAHFSQHRWGGKAAIASTIAPGGSLRMVSKPPNSNLRYELTINDWAKEIREKRGVKLEEWADAQPHPTGFTRFEINHAKKLSVSVNAFDLAEELGHTYAPQIRSGELNISLLVQTGRRLIAISSIEPVSVPLEVDTIQHSSRRIQLGGNEATVSLAWGKIDFKTKNAIDSETEKKYGASPYKHLHLPGEHAYIRYHGRLIQITPISRLKPKGYVYSKNTLAPWVLLVDIERGFVQLNKFKNHIDPATEDELRKLLATFVEPKIQLLLRASESTKPDYSERLEAASNLLAQTLLRAYGDREAVADQFNLPSRESAQIETDTGEGQLHNQRLSKKRLRKLRKFNPRGLPGTRPEPANKGRRPPPPSQTSTSFVIESVQAARLPQFAVSYEFPDASTESILHLPESDSPLILVNPKNAVVEAALNSPTDLGHLVLLRIGAEVLAKAKWNTGSRMSIESFSQAVLNEIAIITEAYRSVKSARKARKS